MKNRNMIMLWIFYVAYMVIYLLHWDCPPYVIAGIPYWLDCCIYSVTMFIQKCELINILLSHV